MDMVIWSYGQYTVILFIYGLGAEIPSTKVSTPEEFVDSSRKSFWNESNKQAEEQSEAEARIAADSKTY